MLRDAVAVNGAQGLNDALELLLVSRPGLAGDPDMAADLTVFAARLLREADPATRPDFGAITSRIIAAAPPETRAAVSYAVTNAVVNMVAPSAPVIASGAKRGTGSTVPSQTRAQAAASGTEQPTADSQTTDSHATDREQPAPLRVGRFLLYPDATVSGVYDSNIFATRNDRVDDLIAVFSPYIEAESTWSRHYLNIKGGAEIGRYDDNSTEDYEDYWTSAEGRIDLGGRSNVYGGLNYDRLHESRESPDDINAAEPTTYDILGAYAGTAHQIGKVGLRLGGTFQDINFDPVDTSLGVVTNSDRDRKLYTGGLRVDVALNSKFGIYGQAAADIRRYKLEPPDSLFDRDSDGGRYIAGMTFKLSGTVEGEAFAGYLTQDYDDPALPEVSAAAFGGSLTYTPNTRSSVTLFADRTVVETTLDGASALLSTAFGLDIEHVVAPRTWLRSSIAYSRGQYQGIVRDDDAVNAEASVQYYLSPYVFVETAYRFRHLHSTTEIEDYDRHQVILRLGGQLYAADIDTPLGASEELMGPQIFGGGYAGAQVGYGGLNSSVAGPRGPDATTTYSDFGGHGSSWGIYGGYGTTFDRLYLGLELEGEAGVADWSFDRGENIRQFSVRKRLAYGVAGRVGYAIGDTALVYGRLGAMRAEFINRYLLGSTLIDVDFTRTGLRFGGGAEIPLNSRLWLRFDYVYTNYESYGIDYDDGIDVFDNDENLFRVGASYRL